MLEKLVSGMVCGWLLLAVPMAPSSSAVEPQAPDKEAENSHAPMTPADDEASSGRDEILNSPSWQETMRNWNDWLSIQKRYDKQQVKQLREQLDAKVQKLSAEELLEFQRELDAKLSVLMGQEARDARLWLAESLSAASESYGKKIRESQPDVANMSAAELRESLDEFELRRARTQEATASFQAAQRDRVRSVQAELRLQHEDSQKAMDRAASSQANAQPGYFVPSYTHQHRRSYADRPAFPFFWGGFW